MYAQYKAGLILTVPRRARARGFIFLTGVGFVSYHSPDRFAPLPLSPSSALVRPFFAVRSVRSRAERQNGDQFVTNLLTSPLSSVRPCRDGQKGDP